MQDAVAQAGPTMGWSSWNTYGVNISDALIRRQADAMVSTGLKPVADYIHSKGLKAGTYDLTGRPADEHGLRIKTLADGTVKKAVSR